MKTKIAVHFAIAAALTAMMTGCCTSWVHENSHTFSADFFFPSTIYETTNQFALEGNEFRKSNFATPLHTFVIIPRDQSRIICFPTNDAAALERTIRNLPMTNILQTNSLPSFYYKIANVRTNQNGSGDIELRLKEYNPPNGTIVLYPFAVVTDVATAPFQIIFFILIASSLGHNC